MSLPTQQEREEWWVLAYAHASFNRSLETCQLLLKNVTDTFDALYLPLAVATHAFYCRPFQRQQGVKKLSKDYVPESWRDIHTAIITFRDKALVHTDADDVKQAGEPLNIVAYRNDGINRSFLAQEIRPHLNYYDTLRSYLPELIRKVRDDIDGIHRKFGEQIPTTDGLHRLNLTGPALFTPFDPSLANRVDF